VPVFRDDQVVGTLGIGIRGERTFTDAETQALLAAGRVLAGPLAHERG
jgi:hypothetical protein